MNPQSSISLKLYTIVFAGILGLQAAWLLVPEFVRSPVLFFPSNDAEDTEVATHRDAAAAAARIGWLRGDLSVDYAITASAPLLRHSTHAPDAETTLIAEHAAARAPYDSRIWLLLAAIKASSNWSDAVTLAQLKMSYYTSPNDVRLIPLRLQIATRSQVISDDELQALVAHEIQTIIHRPNLKQIITDAYHGASPTGRRFIETKLADSDPSFLSELKIIRP